MRMYLFFCDCANGHNIWAGHGEIDTRPEIVAQNFVLRAPQMEGAECPACGAPRSEWLYFAMPAPLPTSLELEDVRAHFAAHLLN